MAKKIVDTPSYPPAPIFYVDQPAAMMLAPHVSRISFGVEDLDGSDFPRPVVSIAIPTLALLRFVNDAKKALESADFKKHAVTHLERSAKHIASSGAHMRPPRTIEVSTVSPKRVRKSVPKAD